MNSSPLAQDSYVQTQYATQDNLRIRVETHEKYSFPKMDFAAWVLDQLPWRGRERVLEVGCGSGIYARPTQARAGHYIGGDLSWGMVQSLPPDIPRVNLDAQWLPLAAASVDVILANHMLYHVPDQDAAAAQFTRVLRPGGYLLAATNAGANRPELNQLLYDAAAALAVPVPQEAMGDALLTFTLENGHALLARHFPQVARHEVETAFIFPTPEPVIAYIGTTRDRLLDIAPPGIGWEQLAAQLHQLLTDHIARHGEFRVHKKAGVFVCRR